MPVIVTTDVGALSRAVTIVVPVLPIAVAATTGLTTLLYLTHGRDPL